MRWWWQPAGLQNKSWFKYPKDNTTYSQGDDLCVRVDTEKYQGH